MPRPRIPRRIQEPPRYLHFKPVGVPRRFLDAVTLTVDEFEAIRLADCLGLDQQEAAERMSISRPTFSRLVESARGKLARGIVEGMEIRIGGGDVHFNRSLRRCRDCGDERQEKAEEALREAIAEEYCRICGSSKVEDLASLALPERHGRRAGRQARRK